MFHLVELAILFTLGLGWWCLVHYAPRSLSLIMPRRFAAIVGGFLFVIGVFAAFAAAWVQKSPDNVLGSFVTAQVGLWFMLAPSAAERGSYEDREVMRRVALMLALASLVIIGALYLRDARHMAVLNLVLITSGFWVTTNYLRRRDGRRH